MLDFKKVKKFFFESSWLWISTTERSLVFVSAYWIYLIFIITCTYFINWQKYYPYLSIPQRSHHYVSTLSKLFAHHSHSTKKVVLLGGSTSRELTSWDAAISESLSQQTGFPVTFINSGWRNQNLATIWTLTEHLAQQGNTTVVIGINYYRFTGDNDELHTHVSSSALPIPISRSLLFSQLRWLNIIPQPEPFTFYGSLKKFDVIIRNENNHSTSSDTLLHQQINDSFNGPQNFYHQPIFSLQEKSRRVNAFIATRGSQFYLARKQATKQWCDFLSYFKNKIPIILLVLPLDPSMDKARSLLDTDFNNLLVDLQAAGAILIDWRNQTDLASTDFYDQQHLVSTGREKIYGKFITMIADQLKSARPF